MRKILIVCSFLLVISGCATLFGADGEGGLIGGAEKAADVAVAAGVPWAGVAKIGLGLIGTVGGFFMGGRRKKKNAQDFVKLLDEVKGKVKDLVSEEEIEKIIMEYAKKNPKFGRYLARIHAQLKGKA